MRSTIIAVCLALACVYPARSDDGVAKKCVTADAAEETTKTDAIPKLGGRVDAMPAQKSRDLVSLWMTFSGRDPDAMPPISNVIVYVASGGAGVMVFGKDGCAFAILAMPVDTYDSLMRIVNAGWHR